MSALTITPAPVRVPCLTNPAQDAAPGPATLAIHAGRRPDPVTGAILTPVYQSTTYVQAAVGLHKGHTYSRASNPTVSVLEEAVAALEGVRFGTATATGLAAITVLAQSVLNAGEHAVLSEVVYGGTVRLFRQVLSRFGVEASFVDTSDPAAVAAAIRPNTRLVFVETPANPTLKLSDLGGVGDAVRAARRRFGSDIVYAVDNTFLTPVLQRPVEFGADVVVHSTTKYIDGHNACVGGVLVTDDERLHGSFQEVRKTLGCIQAPWDAWLTLHGLKTLPLRIREHSQRALAVAQWLERHPRVARVSYPGLASFAQQALAERQHQGGHGGIVSFEVKGGTDAGVAVLNRVKLIKLAESLGAVESLVTHPPTMTHGSIPRAERERLGISEGLVRLSVGLEDVDDLLADLDQALWASANAGAEIDGENNVNTGASRPVGGVR